MQVEWGEDEDAEEAFDIAFATWLEDEGAKSRALPCPTSRFSRQHRGTLEALLAFAF